MTEHQIRTTMRPYETITVSDEELADLERMGIVAGHVPSELSQVPAPTPLVGKTDKAGGTSGGDEEEPQADSVQAPTAARK